jgi:hypothetical protein
MMTVTTSTFHYSYEDTLEESLEASLVLVRDDLDKASRWRPSVVLLTVGGFIGGIAMGVAKTTTGKLIGLLVPILFSMALSISSKKTRMEAARREYELLLRKQFEDKKCHVHDLSIDDSGLIERCPCGTDTRNWQGIKVWHETEKVIVLQLLNMSYHAIPKRVIPPPELQPLRDFLTQHIQ